MPFPVRFMVVWCPTSSSFMVSAMMNTHGYHFYPYVTFSTMIEMGTSNVPSIKPTLWMRLSLVVPLPQMLSLFTTHTTNNTTLLTATWLVFKSHANKCKEDWGVTLPNHYPLPWLTCVSRTSLFLVISHFPSFAPLLLINSLPFILSHLLLVLPISIVNALPLYS